jgi:hypothetical protein
VTGDLTAVDVQDFAGDEGRWLQEEDAVDDVAGLAQASEGCRCAQAFEHFADDPAGGGGLGDVFVDGQHVPGLGGLDRAGAG